MEEVYLIFVSNSSNLLSSRPLKLISRYISRIPSHFSLTAIDLYLPYIPSNLDHSPSPFPSVLSNSFLDVHIITSPIYLRQPPLISFTLKVYKDDILTVWLVDILLRDTRELKTIDCGIDRGPTNYFYSLHCTVSMQLRSDKRHAW